MKYILSLLVIILCGNRLLAQQPSISYLLVDEAKSRLLIHGSFGIDSGSVSIEDTTLGIISWSDSLIICDLPDSGKGAGGHVEVQTLHGLSNKRVLSIFSLMVDYLYWGWKGVSPPHELYLGEGQRWSLNWRADIRTHPNNSNAIRFEISKSSYGNYIQVPYIPGYNFPPPNYQFPWRDSSSVTDSSISMKGSMDLTSFRIKFDTLKMSYARLAQFFPGKYIPSTINFDTNGYISNYIHVQDHLPVENYESDSLYNAKILFAPGTRNSVSNPSQNNPDLINIFYNIGSEDHIIKLHTSSSFGETTASLYSIDGRLLKREKISIPAPGIYSFDVSGLHTQLGFFMLQSAKGVVARKVMLSEP